MKKEFALLLLLPLVICSCSNKSKCSGNCSVKSPSFDVCQIDIGEACYYNDLDGDDTVHYIKVNSLNIIGNRLFVYTALNLFADYHLVSESNNNVRYYYSLPNYIDVNSLQLVVGDGLRYLEYSIKIYANNGIYDADNNMVDYIEKNKDGNYSISIDLSNEYFFAKSEFYLDTTKMYLSFCLNQQHSLRNGKETHWNRIVNIQIKDQKLIEEVLEIISSSDWVMKGVS